MKKYICYVLLSSIFSYYSPAQTAHNNITLQINNVVINDGTVYVGIFSTADSYKKEEPEYLLILEAINTTLVHELSLQDGEYVITAIQDANNNTKLDFGYFGIPKELLGISNYNGKGFPSKNFDKQKILVDTTTDTIVINLYKF